MTPKNSYLGMRLTSRVNRRLNEICGAAGQYRATIVELALLDFLECSSRRRRALNKAVESMRLNGFAPRLSGDL